MARDLKYGKVTLEYGTIGEDEVVVVFRAQDALLPKLLMYYHLFCLKAGTKRRHLRLVMDAIDAVQEWQRDHPDQVKLPSSETSKDWLPS